MIALLYLSLSFLISLLLVPFLQSLISTKKLVIRNYRSHDVPSGGGILFVLSSLAVAAVMVLVSNMTKQTSISFHPDVATGLVAIILGIGFLGLLDDLLGDRSTSGFRGHFQLLLKGTLTTGMIKALGGVIFSFLVVQPFSDSLGIAVLNTLVMALFINFFNLLDLRPGRAIKVSLILGIAMFGAQAYRYRFDAALFAQEEGFLIPWGIFLGPAFVLLYQELKERLMLGDVGSNIVGAIIGYIFTVTFQDLWTKSVVLALLFSLNLLSEKFSFTRIIERTPGLRQLDELGRLK